MNRSFLPRWTLCWALSLLLAFPSATLIDIGEARAAKAKADAAQVARGIHQWVAYLAKRADAAKQRLAKDQKRAVPFWESVKRLSAAASKLERDLTAKRPAYLQALGDARSALTSLQVTYQQSGAKDKNIDKALTNIDRGVKLLEQNAGPAGAGKSGSKSLTAKERRQLDALKAKQKELQRKLQKVEAKTGKNRAAIRDIRTHSDRIYYARNTAADFFAALLAARIIDGLLWGWHWWWGPWGGWIGPWCGGFVDIYYESLEVIDVDWTAIEAEIAVDDYLLDAGVEQLELDAIDRELVRDDFALSDAEMEAIAEAGLGGTAEALETEPLPATGLPGDGEALPDIDDLPEPEPLPEPESGLEADTLPAPDREAFTEPDPISEPTPMDDAGGFDSPLDDGAGFDGGGFDGGGMDFDAGGMDFDGDF